MEKKGKKKQKTVAHLLVISISNHFQHYLQACALVRERRAEETCDNAHDCLSYITLQHGVCMLPVTGVVAYLSRDREDNNMKHSHWITLPGCNRLVHALMLKGSRTHHKKQNSLSPSVHHSLKCVMAYPANVNKEVLKQLPHVVGCINLLHLHLCVHITVV